MTRKFNNLITLKTIYFSELRLRSSDLDMASLREKLDQARMDSLQESEETMAELKNVYEREKLMLMEENKKLQFEYERTVEINNRLQLERRQFEEDYHDLRNKKEAVAQWEAQISEIINWYVFLLFKFVFSKNATKIDEIFTSDLTLCSKCQIDSEDFINFCGLFLKT